MSQTITETESKLEYSNGDLIFEKNKESGRAPAKTELLYDGNFYDITSWMKKHPGGGIIEMFASTGEDAIHAVQQFHFRSTERVMNIMKALPQRKAPKNELCQFTNFEKNNSLTEDFLALFEELKSEGYFEPAPWHVASRFFDLILLFCVGHWIYFSAGSVWTGFLGMYIISLCYGRVCYLSHECGHHSLTGNPNVDRTVLSFLFGSFVGLSGSFWISQHSRHHALPQNLTHDVDLKTLPLLAFNKKIVTNPKDGKTFLIQNQKLLFLLDTAFVVLTWNIFLHPRYALRKGNYLELFFMTIHKIYNFYAYGILNGIVILSMTSMFLLTNFTLNHSHMPVTDVATHWVEQTFVHTANIRSSYFGWVDYWMGNLNHQIEHHLFPTMPQFKNKFIRDRVKALAKKHNLPYNLISYNEAVVKSLNNLDEVSRDLM